MNKELTPLEERLHDLSYVLSYEEIEELRNLCYEHSNSWCPLSDFFNDVELNKSETYNKNQAYKDLWLIALIVFDKKKELKALEIIKREPSAVIEIITTYDTWKEYIKDYPISDKKIWHIIKNESEFDLLKEVLL